jgi:hypothetical protein
VLAISLTTILEQVAAEAKGTKNLSGNISDFEALMEPTNLAALGSAVDAFGYLAFHPGADQAVRRYVEEGTLASDSGRQILTLFSLGERATWPRVVNEQSFGAWLQLDTSVHPAYEMVRWLFEPYPAPPLPGLALFDSLVGDDEVVYVPLDAAADPAAVRAQLRRVFALAQEALVQGVFADRLGAALQRERMAYARSGRKSIREVLIRSSQVVDDRISDIAAVAGLAV